MRDYQGLEWFTNIDDAYKVGQYSHVLVLFTGSDWCPPCKKLASEKLNTHAFHALIKEKGLGLVILDSPSNTELRSQINTAYVNEMSEQFQIRGVPTIVILDENKKETSRNVGYSERKFDNFISKSLDK